MTLHTLPTDDEPNGYDEHTEMISQARGQVLTELAAGLKALQRAGAGVAELRGGVLDESSSSRDETDATSPRSSTTASGSAAPPTPSCTPSSTSRPRNDFASSAAHGLATRPRAGRHRVADRSSICHR